MKKLEADFSKLSWVRIFDSIHIPPYLIDQIKEKEFTTERFIEYQKVICVENENGKLVINPYNLLFVITDEDRHVQGFLWAVVDILNGCLCINNFSMDKKFWSKGKAVEFLREKCLEIIKGAKLKKIFWCTKHTKYCEKYGFKKSPSVLMEYNEEDNGTSTGQIVNLAGPRCETNRVS